MEQFIAARTEEELKRFEAVKAREVQKTVSAGLPGLTMNVTSTVAEQTRRKTKLAHTLSNSPLVAQAEQRAALVIQNMYKIRMNKTLMRAVAATIWVKVCCKWE